MKRDNLADSSISAYEFSNVNIQGGVVEQAPVDGRKPLVESVRGGLHHRLKMRKSINKVLLCFTAAIINHGNVV